MKNLTPDEALRLEHRVIIHDKHHNNWRVNGKPKIWKISGAFQVPLKHGLYDFAYINDGNVDSLHLPSECGNLEPYAEEKAAAIAEAASERIRKEAEQRYLKRFIPK